MTRSALLIPLTLLLAVSPACRKRPPADGPTPTAQAPGEAGEPGSAPPSDSLRDPSARSTVAGERGDAGAAFRSVEERVRRERALALLLAPVHFDFDDDRIRDDVAVELERKVALLRANPSLRLELVGHTDERGSTEYNLALGQRRAESVRAFFVAYGLPPERFTTLSYGEEQPVDPGHSEEAWARNRRVEFRVVAGSLERVPEELVPLLTR